MSIILRTLAFAIGMLAGVIELRAQGGPPMITDDPGTPGPRKWEINLAVAWAHRPAETSLDMPAIDLNYGLGERIQPTLQTAPVLLKRRERGPIWGLGATEAALNGGFWMSNRTAYQFRYSHVSFLTFSNPRSAAAYPKPARARNCLCRWRRHSAVSTLISNGARLPVLSAGANGSTELLAVSNYQR